MKREKGILFTIVSSGVAKRIEPAKRLQEEGQQRIAANVIDNDSGLSVVAGLNPSHDMDMQRKIGICGQVCRSHSLADEIIRICRPLKPAVCSAHHPLTHRSPK